jgi:hypothetical protein
VSGEEQYQMRARWLTGRFFTVAAGLVVMAGALAGPGAAAASAAGCQAWTGGQPLSPGTLDNSLSSVTVLSPCDVWAVGLDISSGAFQTLIEHWNGFSWTLADSPDPGSGNNFLTSVRAASATSIWAVGSASDGTASKTLIEHWNGTAWKTVPSPSPGSNFNALNGVRVVSASNVWAVGDYSGGNGTHKKTLILHWNGATWKQVPSPSPGGSGNDNDLFAVAASSARDAWAVGEIVTGTGIQSLILHWNGRRWARMASPSPGTIDELLGVGATSASNAWAVGNVSAGTAQTQQTLVLHWNGRRWARVTSPNPGGQAQDNRLYAVAATSASNAWAVGTYQTATGQSSIVLRWNGRKWVHVNNPSPGTQNGLLGVAASSAGNAWAVGSFSSGGPFQALALHCC